MIDNQFIHIIKKNDKKIYSLFKNLVIISLITFLLSIFTAQSFNVLGQNNNTEYLAENNIVHSIPDEKADLENNQSIEEQNLSKSTTISPVLGDTEDNNNNQQNTNNDSTLLTTGNLGLSKPDRDCLFDPSMPKCAPDENGKCPSGFAMNEDGQCFPRGGCPNKYHRPDDDETGRCIPNSEGCPIGMIFRPDNKSCGYKDDVCSHYPKLNECKTNDKVDEEIKKTAFNSGYTHGCSDAKIQNDSERYIDQPGKGPIYHTSDFMDGYYQGFDYCSTTATNNASYNSGYQHGCNDAKIDNISKRYINQLGNGPTYHTKEFMRGYDDGFDVCSNNKGSSESSTGTFKIVVQTINQLPNDLTGTIMVSVDHQPENIVKYAYGLYFPGGGEMISKTFTFKSSDVPIGTGFEVNLEYGDGKNQYKFGENSPKNRSELVDFNIS